MSSAPFPNSYVSRLVAPSDSKACSICYKPTTTVLVSSNNADFFYICSSHLKDKAFAEPIHPDDYLAFKNEKNELESQLRSLNKKADLIKPYSWNKVMNNLGWSNSSEEGETTKEKHGSEKDELVSKSESFEASKAKKKSYEDLIKESKELGKKVTQLNDSIASFKFKNFKLDTNVYRMRINSVLQAQTRLKRQKEIQNPGFFPLTPTHELI